MAHSFQYRHEEAPLYLQGLDWEQLLLIHKQCVMSWTDIWMKSIEMNIPLAAIMANAILP